MANRSKKKFEDLSEAEQEAFRKRLHSGGLLRNMFADFAEEDGPFTSQSRNMYSWEESEEEGPSTSNPLPLDPFADSLCSDTFRCPILEIFSAGLIANPRISLVK